MDKKWRGLPCLKTQNRSGVDSDHIAIDYFSKLIVRKFFVCLVKNMPFREILKNKKK